jgi:hypothetical protein
LDGRVLSTARDALILVCIHRQNIVRLRELFGKFPEKSPHFEEESFEIARNVGGFLKIFEP